MHSVNSLKGSFCELSCNAIPTIELLLLSKRLAEEEPSTGLGPTGYGAQDEGLPAAFAHAVATGLAAKMLKKILERFDLYI